MAIEKPSNIITTPESRDINAIISSMLPSGCFVKYEDNQGKHLPNKLFPKVKHLKEGSSIIIEMRGSDIINVKLDDETIAAQDND